jgi:carboxymethylenebutenolidase
MPELETPYFLVRPRGEARAGVVVIQEGDGVTQWLLRFCERLAREGYAIAAPDMFFRTGGPGASTELRAQGAAVQQDEALADLGAARAALRGLGAERIGVTGFCMGGSYTWQAAVYTDDYDAAVGFYGVGIVNHLLAPRCPTLLFFGANDPYIPREQIEKVRSRHPDTFVYESAGHAFMRDGTEFHVPEAADDAWPRLLTHFDEHLRS